MKVVVKILNVFGVLQTRWGVLRGPAYGWDRNRLAEIITACIIMHNMIVEDEGEDPSDVQFSDNVLRHQLANRIQEGRMD
jgi:hypothetical protein|uniref:DDE Tnp4 domain-containing protein n=1 Tax=Zea mays TaxID=4577 RepID=B6U7S8_MAIZE|nr:hypothetical protein [Zea mays]